MNTSVLFDLDGVLVDTKPFQFICLQEAIYELTGHRVEKTEDLTQDITTFAKLHWLASRGVIKVNQIEEIYELKREIAERYFVKLPVSQDKVELFEWLNACGVKFGIVTNANRRSSEILLRTVGLEPYVKVLVTNQDVKHPKPHPEPYIRGMLLVSRRYNGSPLFDDFVILEDSTVGLAAARATGARVVKVESVDQVNIDFLGEIFRGRSQD